jgi:hypothetical protein
MSSNSNTGKKKEEKENNNFPRLDSSAVHMKMLLESKSLYGKWLDDRISTLHYSFRFTF